MVDCHSECGPRMTEVLALLNNFAFFASLSFWLWWGYCRIPNASSLRELQMYEQLTDLVGVDIALLGIAVVWSVWPAIRKPVSVSKWLRSERFFVLVIFVVLALAAGCTYFARVLQNQPPMITKVRYEEAGLLPLAETSIKARASDPDGKQERLVFLWESEQVAFERPRSNELRFQAPQAPGDYEITIIVFDSKGAYDKKVVPIRVIGD